MANTAPSHVTGNTHFGRFLNENKINESVIAALNIGEEAWCACSRYSFF